MSESRIYSAVHPSELLHSLCTRLSHSPGIAMTQTLQPSHAIPIFATLSSNWPNASEWATLNSSLGGCLQALRPWAAFCYTSDPLYNAEECQSVLAGYDNDTQAGLHVLYAMYISGILIRIISARGSSRGASVGELGVMWL